MKLGKYNFNKAKILAPMAGSTDISFREFAYELGADFAVTEMIMVNSLIYKNPKGFLLMERGERDNPFIVQLAGSDWQSFYKVIEHIKNSNADVVDINIGCPAKKIVKKGAGSALLKTPEKIYDIIRALKDNLDIPISAKIRLGWDDNSLNYKEVIKIIQKAKADMLTVHRRTKANGYGPFYPDSIFEEIRQVTDIPLIANGEIRNNEDMEKMFSIGVDGVMIGKEAIKRPWVFSNIDKIDLKTRYELMKKHFSLIRKYYDKKIAIYKVKKFYNCYIKNIKGSKEFKNKIMPINDYDIAMKEIESFFKQVI